MARKKPDSSSTPSKPEILQRLSGLTAEIEKLRASSVKYQALKDILARVVEQLPPHTRMPGIRDLSLGMGTSLVTTQRAVAELLDENLLYSKPRSGVFVSDRTGGTTGPASSATPPPASNHPFRVVFDFATDSGAPHQRKFWEELTALFSHQYPNVTPALHFVPDVYARPKPYDAWERYDWNRSRFGNLDDVLDIADFAGALLPTQLGTPSLLPLYHRTYFTFFNQTLLEKHRLPAPDYRTFAAQKEYLSALAPELQQLGFDPRPYSTQEPVTLFGSRIREFCQAAVTGSASPETRQELVEVIEKLVSYCHLFRYSLKDQNEWMQGQLEFMRGQSPFFVGYSVDYWEMSQKKLPFELKAYPTLLCDDTFFLWPRVGQISSRSEHPMESMHFLLFLLREEAQRRFAETGNFGANPALDLRPETTAAPDWITETLRRSQPFHFPSSEGYYLAINVLGGEIWRSLVEKVPATETFDRALQMGRSYLKNRPAASRPLSGDKA